MSHLSALKYSSLKIIYPAEFEATLLVQLVAAGKGCEDLRKHKFGPPPVASRVLEPSERIRDKTKHRTEKKFMTK